MEAVELARDRRDRARERLMQVATGEALTYQLVYALPNPDGSLYPKWVPGGDLPAYGETNITEGLVGHFGRVEQAVMSVHWYLGGLVDIDLADPQHRRILRDIVLWVNDDLILSFGFRDVAYVAQPLPDPLAPPSYFGFRSLAHLCRANYTAFFCLHKWFEIGTDGMCRREYRSEFRHHRRATVLRNQKAWVQAADAAYLLQRLQVHDQLPCQFADVHYED